MKLIKKERIGKMITFKRGIKITEKVYLDGKYVGIIKQSINTKRECGWSYFPKKSKVGGKLFKKLNDCKNSLE
jgi:hypothetical protein